ncbi:spermatogenesis-associated protein 6-like isoform X2 [Glandiceps talaboti]
MPRKALRVIVELNIEAVTCPGTFLRERDDIYLSVCLLGYQKKTICVPSVFPLLFHQVLRFERTFTNCVEPAQLSLALGREHVYIELIQLKPDYEGTTVLAYYELSARDFLYPDPYLSPSYTQADREILLNRTLAFRGISPKIEFSCSTTVKDSSTPTLDELRDFTMETNSDEEVVTLSTRRRSRRRKRTKSYEVPTISRRVKSPSLKRRQLFDESTRQHSIDDRPPFVVRRVDTFNKSLSPGQSPSPKRPSSAPLLPSHSLSPKRRQAELRRSFWSSSMKPHRHYYHEAIREPEVSLSSSTTELSDDTEELIEGLNYLEFSDSSENDVLTSSRLKAETLPSSRVEYGRLPSYLTTYTPRSHYYSSPPSPRATSPVLLRSSMSDRYGDPPYTPTRADRIHDRVEHLLRKNRVTDDENDNEVDTDSIEALRTSLASDRLNVSQLSHFEPDRSLSIHIDNAEHWTNAKSEWTTKSHRAVFDDTMNKLYRQMYREVQFE